MKTNRTQKAFWELQAALSELAESACDLRQVRDVHAFVSMQRSLETMNQRCQRFIEQRDAI